MLIPRNLELLVWLSALAGAVHVLAPDHWVPGSILSWQRGWRLSRSAAFAIGALTLHAVAGFLIYLLCEDWIADFASTSLFVFTVGLILFFTLVRSLRFSRIREVFRTGPHSIWGVVTVLSLLGPCESLIPILVKAKQLGMGYFVPFAAFLLGTLATGVLMTVFGRAIWNRPFLLPRGLHIVRRASTVIPLAACLVLGLGVILRMR